MLLEQKEIISLKDPSVNFLPEIENSDFDKKKINLFHLLTHTSGISEFSVGIFASQMFSLMTTGKSQIKEYNCDLKEFLEYVSNLEPKDVEGFGVERGYLSTLKKKIRNKNWKGISVKFKNKLLLALQEKQTRHVLLDER